MGPECIQKQANKKPLERPLSIAETNENSGLVTFLSLQCVHISVPAPDFIFPLSTFPLTRACLIEYKALSVLIGNEHRVLPIIVRNSGLPPYNQNIIYFLHVHSPPPKPH